MHPALSIIVFTTSSGLGYGLAFFLGFGVLDPAAPATKAAYVVALGLISAGLLASTLHLGNPQRAWRALSQWRSSWLSREGVLAIATFVPLCLSAWATLFESRHSWPAGLAGSLGCAATVYCTAMIYASLRTVEAWHSPLTPAAFLAFAAAGGAVLATFFAALGAGDTGPLAALALGLLVVAWATKLVWRRRLGALTSASTPETATGLGALGRVRLLERPHGTENYLTREMGFRIARKHARKLVAIAFGLGGGVPIVLLAASALFAAEGGLGWPVFTFLALLAYAGGLLVERWLFFAEARHSVMNYYGG
ncbi:MULTISPECIES: dimethyl sulfoxide reductase anchor subunit family protein [Nitratireductor]|uniref:dimethyl sulfoxide reductase anchor subunit family protein n=1 Tax=Nitratireductor TaxID=245876 RepID=UPI000D0DD217|nr:MULTISPECIES: DmsC/YnfH family molybdoenzyme membrane anchor subunit [Nitratireductor]PSM17912.1 DMSO reductase [Nitratireductor sp. StC3]